MSSTRRAVLAALAVGLMLPWVRPASAAPGKAAARAQAAKERIKRQRWPTRRPNRKIAGPPKLGPVPFPEGERLLFDIEMLGAKAGEAVFAVGKRTRKDGRAVVSLGAFLRSSEFLSKFYPIDDQLRVVADERTFLPIESTFNIRENGKSIDYVTDFQQDRTLVRSVRTKNGRRLDRNYTPEGPLFDALTSVYAARRLPLKPGLKFEYYAWDGRRERLVTVEVVGEEQVKTPMGLTDTLKVDISSVITGGFIKPSALDRPRKQGTAWFAKDPFRTPVKLTTPTKLGEARAVLNRRWVEADPTATR